MKWKKWTILGISTGCLSWRKNWRVVKMECLRRSVQIMTKTSEHKHTLTLLLQNGTYWNIPEKVWIRFWFGNDSDKLCLLISSIQTTFSVYLNIVNILVVHHLMYHVLCFLQNLGSEILISIFTELRWTISKLIVKKEYLDWNSDGSTKRMGISYLYWHKSLKL